jgi:hypothetical protein
VPSWQSELKKAIKTKNRRGKKPHFFVMSLGGFVSKKVLIMFLNSPCYETPKNAIKKKTI